MATIETISPTQAASWLARGEAVLLDVREPSEFAAAHIAGANNAPLSKLSTSALPANDDKKIILHCQKGGRSSRGCQLLVSGRTAPLYNLEGGLEGWIAAGLPIVTSGKRTLPLDRQVQMAVGTGVLAATALGYSIHPGFHGLAAFFGAGLLFASFTGICGLAMVLAKAPWNQTKA